MDRRAWQAMVIGLQRVRHNLVVKQQHAFFGQLVDFVFKVFNNREQWQKQGDAKWNEDFSGSLESE